MKRRVSLKTVTLSVFCFINLAIMFNSVSFQLTHDRVECESIQKTIVSTEVQKREQSYTNDSPESVSQLDNLKEQLAVKESIISFLSQPVINNHNFTYISNPTKTCASGNINVLFVTPSSVGNFENREKVRRRIKGTYAESSKGQAKLLFFLGKPTGEDFKDVQRKINLESKKYGDIVQDGFEDTYKNIRLKAVSMLKWAVLFCGNAKYVIRTDDDVKVRPHKLVVALKKKSFQRQNFILGMLRINDTPVRDEGYKYYMSYDEYPNIFYPTYALGGLLGMPISSVKLLYQAAFRVKPVWLDDVFITGICSMKDGVTLEQDNDFVFKHRSW